MTCEDVVATGRYPYTGRFGVLSKDDHKAVENAMELVKVTELRDLMFDRISDGQRQRVMLARAICHELDHLDGHLYVEKAEGPLQDMTYEDEEEE